jgi:hypothetical protein
MGQVNPRPTLAPADALRQLEARAPNVSNRDVLDALRRSMQSGLLGPTAVARLLEVAVEAIDGPKNKDQTEAEIRAEFEAERRRMAGEPPPRRRRPKGPLA